jgi:hypothetical protein
MSYIVVAFMLVAGQGYFWISATYNDPQECDRVAASVMEEMRSNHAGELQAAAAQCVPMPAHVPRRDEAAN